MKNFKRYFCIFLVLLAVDILLKFYTYHYIPQMSWMYPFYPYGGIGIFNDVWGISFSINHIQNTGAAWGVFNKFPNILFVIRIAILIGLIFYFIQFNKDRKKNIPLLLIITGACGNIIDFIFYKKVIDMFYFTFERYSFPVFNFADAMITVGIVWLVISFIFKPKAKKI